MRNIKYNISFDLIVLLIANFFTYNAMKHVLLFIAFNMNWQIILKGKICKVELFVACYAQKATLMPPFSKSSTQKVENLLLTDVTQARMAHIAALTI